MEAAYNNDIEIAMQLIEAKANLYLQDEYGRTDRVTAYSTHIEIEYLQSC